MSAHLHLEGYNPNGPATHGAEYARAHPDDLPDGYVANREMYFGRQRIKTGTQADVAGVPSLVVAGKAQAALVLDTRRVDALTLETKLPVGRLLLWRGLYWRVNAVHGVFVQLGFWGTKRRKQGWRIVARGGKDYASAITE